MASSYFEGMPLLSEEAVASLENSRRRFRIMSEQYCPERTIGLASSFLSEISNGRLIQDRNIGLCGNLSDLLYSEGCSFNEVSLAITKMQEYFKAQGRNHRFPVERYPDVYASNRDKYRPETRFGSERLKLAYDLSEYFKDELNRIRGLK